jgi:hypothetical protein
VTRESARIAEDLAAAGSTAASRLNRAIDIDALRVDGGSQQLVGDRPGFRHEGGEYERPGRGAPS